MARYQDMSYVYENGRLTAGGALPPPLGTLSPEGLLITPGLADVHVHLREPGFSYKETIKTGTRAAARGGYTAVCAMPNVKPAPDSVPAIAVQEALIARDAVVRAYPMATITRGGLGAGELAEIAALASRAVAFSDDGHGVQSEETMRSAMITVQAAGGLISAHCEDRCCPHPESEWRQLERDLKLVRATGCRYHACHISCRESVALMRAAKRDGLPVTCETAPHYLLLCKDDIEDDGRFKMNPPIGSASDREALVAGCLDGTVDIIATDHAPHAESEKAGGFESSLNGVVGLECAFPALYTKLVLGRGFPLERLLYMLIDAPKARFGLAADGDMAAFDLKTEYTIDPAEFASLGRATPFAGMRVRGGCVYTQVGGKAVWLKEAT